MATVLLPRSLLALFPGAERRHEVAAGTVGSVIDELEAAVPGIRDRLVQAGPRLRPHINVFVDGESGDLATIVGASSVVHVIPAVSGGAAGDPAEPVGDPAEPVGDPAEPVGDPAEPVGDPAMRPSGARWAGIRADRDAKGPEPGDH